MVRSFSYFYIRKETVLNTYRQILINYWGYPDFRPLQEDIIRQVADYGRDTLGLLPTGGGKSVIFQVPGLAKEGLCIVVTPLIALMKDQVENLKRRNIKAIAIYSGLSHHEIDVALDNCIYGGYKFLYVSPERLGTEIFRTRLQKMKISLIAVDEAHCISQWGYDFRPSYLKIADIREHLHGVPVLALTATATPEVVDDIQEKLKFRQKNALKKSFERKNLVYVVRETEDKLRKLLQIAGSIKGTGVVYVRSRKRTKEIAEYLRKNKISADYYHAGMSNELRDMKQSEWKNDRCRIIVATNAFGMGIDKPDVRFVVHMDLPDSLEAYFQEAGRAGRDEKTAWAILLYHDSDRIKLEKNIIRSFPEKAVIKNIYNALGNYFQLPLGAGKNQAFDFNIFAFSRNFGFEVLVIFHSLKILQREGYIEYTEEVNNPSRVHFLVSRDDLYKFQVANRAFDTFIKLLLRSYTGFFSDYVNIDELALAKKAGVEIDVVYKFLQQLDKAKIINYIPRKKTPFIIFTEERLEEKSLFLSKENYEDRKKRYIDKVEAVLHYATTSSKCRSAQLLAYFGEKDTDRCGRCDVCQKRNELELSKYEFDLILREIKETVKKQPVPLNDLVESIKHPE
ncbi:MAG: RecQ family ATP-dependent DNA helicase, partial [Bacteroidetes bacterium]|nr:RecQ family ATP-dependent DNA helicase [Bacteroidota bacterium]